MSRERDDDAAIIGMACIFPKAPDVRGFWENVVGGVDAIDEPPADWGADFLFDPASTANDRLYTTRGGYLGELARFDPVAFGVMPRAVDGGEPEHFIALQVAHDALLDAGYSGDGVDHSRTAVILGRGTYINRGVITMIQHTLVVDQTIDLLRQLHPEHTRAELDAIKEALKDSLPAFNAETAPGLCHSVMCGRISNRMDLMGPSYAVDAACSSSLIALEGGMRLLAARTSDLVVVGGVQVSTSFPIALVFAQLGALSRRGESRPFHPESDGLLLGEGVGVLVLRRRADAERDGDTIYAVVRGIGVASDGRAAALLAPRVEGEELAMRRAYATAEVSPDDIGLVEAHGTGTPVGDATEVEALRRVFGTGVQHRTCALGSVKSMIGHPIPAAGAAGLIKAALALHDRVLPPTLHADGGHPGLVGTPFFVPDEARPWVHGRSTPRRAAVSAFGFGGINAHVVLEEHV